VNLSSSTWVILPRSSISEMSIQAKLSQSYTTTSFVHLCSNKRSMKQISSSSEILFAVRQNTIFEKSLPSLRLAKHTRCRKYLDLTLARSLQPFETVSRFPHTVWFVKTLSIA
jgi:hypothetical protein